MSGGVGGTLEHSPPTMLSTPSLYTMPTTRIRREGSCQTPEIRRHCNIKSHRARGYGLAGALGGYSLAGALGGYGLEEEEERRGKEGERKERKKEERERYRSSRWV